MGHYRDLTGALLNGNNDAAQKTKYSHAPLQARRRQARLGRLTPVEYEAIMYEQVALAA